jgi:hypothetical protein
MSITVQNAFMVILDQYKGKNETPSQRAGPRSSLATPPDQVDPVSYNRNGDVASRACALLEKDTRRNRRLEQETEHSASKLHRLLCVSV